MLRTALKPRVGLPRHRNSEPQTASGAPAWGTNHGLSESCRPISLDQRPHSHPQPQHEPLQGYFEYFPGHRRHAHGPSGSKYGPQPHDLLVVLKGEGRVRGVAKTLHIPMHDYNHRKHPLVGAFGCIHGSCPPPGALSRDGKDPKPRNHLFTINNVSHASVVQLAHPSLCTGMCPPPTTQTMRYGLSQACAARSSIPGSQIYSFWCGPHGGSDAGPRLVRGQYGRNMVYTGPNHRK